MPKKMNEVKTKSENKQAIFRYILENGSASKQDLFADLGFSLPTIKQALESLKNETLIKEGEKIENTGGRNAISYRLNEDSLYAIGVYISMHHLTCVSVNIAGTILYAKRERCRLNLQSPAYMNRIAAIIEEVKEQSGMTEEKFTGVGIALPTLISKDGESVMFGMTTDFSGVTRQYFAGFIPYPVRIFHDSEAGGFAEMWGTSDRKNMVYLNLNGSVGSSVFMNGHLYQGDNQRAGELGHTIIDPHSSKKCYCGRTGCFDTLCNTSVLENYTDENLAAFFDLVRGEDPGAMHVWKTYLKNLAYAIHNVRLMFDCSIVIGGYIGSYIEPFMEDLYQEVDSLSVFNPFSRTYLQPCKYKIEATAAGAGLMMVERFIDTL